MLCSVAWCCVGFIIRLSGKVRWLYVSVGDGGVGVMSENGWNNY